MSTASKLLALPFLCSLAFCASAQSDLVTVTSRVNADEQGQALSTGTVQGYRDSLSVTGTWADVNYPDKSITGWAPATHTVRLLAMARAYTKSGHALYRDAATSNAIHRALGWWLANDFTSSNWWYNEIDTPQKLGRTILLLGGEASTGEVATAMTMLNRAQNYMSWTGQNRLWEAGNTLVKGLIQSNAGICATSSAAINGLNIVTTSEGIQPDFSFQQHGPQLYTGGYGAAFASDAPFWMDMLRGTAWAGTTSQTAAIVNYLLEGVRWEIWEKQWAFDVTGRGISRGVPSATSMVTPFYRMTNIAPAQAAQFASFANALGGGGVFGNTMKGNKFYWHSDQAVHRAANWSVTVRMCSTRVQGTETGNNEGLKDYYLGDCTTFFLADGNEYLSIQPMWDWRKLPGVTCPQKTGALPLLDWNGYKGSNSFVGGVSDGTNGAAIMNLTRDGLSAKKASFMFDDAAVFLGAGISCTNITNAIVTTINQSLWNGSVTIGRSASTQIFAAGQFVITNTTWLKHDGFGYLPMDTNILWIMSLQSQSGRWYDINNAYSTQWMSTNVFTLWLSHGAKPTNATYAYAVVPALTSSVMPALAASPPVTVLTNSTTLQAAYHFASHQLQAVFQQPGALTFPDGTRFEADASCALLARVLPDGLQLRASRPDQTTAALTVRVSRALSGPGATWMPAQFTTQIVIPMPSGNSSGSSTAVSLTGIAIGPPGVSSAYGADALLTSATLNGALTNGGAADIMIVWGTTDSGTNLAPWPSSVRMPGIFEGLFSTVASNLLSGSCYVYRCYASNSFGTAWSAPRTLRTTSGAVTPAAFTGLTMWLDADDVYGSGTNAPDGSSVSKWTDKSGSARNALGGANTGSWPRVKAAALNGHTVVTFDGGDVLDAGTTIAHDNTRGMTIFAVCLTPAASNIAVISKDWWSGNQREWVIHSGDYQCQQQTNVFNAANQVSFQVTSNVQQLAGCWQPGLRNELFRDGASLGISPTPAAFMSASSAHILVGCANNLDAGRYLTGDIAEIVIYSRALTTYEFHQLGVSLAAKYALPYAQNMGNPDTDDDGLPDEYERALTGGVAALSGNSDTDNDGVSDSNEWLAGTSPLDAASVFDCRSVSTIAGELITITWSSVTGKVYQIESAGQPTATYASLTSNIAALPPMNTATIAVAQAGAIIRVKLQP